MRSLELLSAGRVLSEQSGRPLVALLIGNGITAFAGGMFSCGADQVLVADHPGLGTSQLDPLLETIAHLCQASPPHVMLMGHTMPGQELAGRLAVRLNAALVSDCVALRVEAERIEAVHPIFGGTLLATASPKSYPLIATIRPRAFPCPQEERNRSGHVISCAVDEKWLGSRTTIQDLIQKIVPLSSLPDADVVVAGGMGMGAPGTFQLLEALAAALKGVVGCTRAVVEAGWRPYSEQIGLTGQTISPRLYLACGIHGATQHLDGIRSSRTLVAVNSDANAPLMKMADLALVGDARELIPILLEDLRTAKSMR